jgi:hypothetical protein
MTLGVARAAAPSRARAAVARGRRAVVAARRRSAVARAIVARRAREVVEVDAEVDGGRTNAARTTVALALTLALTLATPHAARAREFFPQSPPDDPIEPFSVFGTVEKAFSVAVLDESGSKIVARKRGMSVKSCVNVVPASRQGPRGPPEALRPSACAEAEALGEIREQRDMLKACAPACKASCSRAIAEYDEGQRKTTGFGLDAKAKERVLKACVVTCGKDCEKAGKSYDYIIPFRF